LLSSHSDGFLPYKKIIVCGKSVIDGRLLIIEAITFRNFFPAPVMLRTSSHHFCKTNSRIFCSDSVFLSNESCCWVP